MTVKDLINSDIFEAVNSGIHTETKIERVYCCDMLSLALARASEGCAWITVICNINTLAVAYRTKAACVIIAEGVAVDENFRKEAESHGITVFRTTLPVFEAALKLHNIVKEE